MVLFFSQVLQITFTLGFSRLDLPSGLYIDLTLEGVTEVSVVDC